VRLRLFWKLGLSYLALLLLALYSVYLYSSRSWERAFLEAAYRHLEALERVAEGRTPDLDDDKTLVAWTDWMSESGARVTVIASDGTVLADSDDDPARMENHGSRPEVQAAFSRGRGRATRFSATVRRELVYVAVRVPRGTDDYAVIRFAQPLGRVQEAIDEVLAPLATVSLAVLVLGGGISLLVSRRFSDRVNVLKAFSRRVAMGDFRPEPLAKEQDEIDELTSSLNQTAERLASSMRAIEKERNQSASILSSMSEGVAVVDREERVLFANPAFRRALQERGEGELDGRQLVELTRQSEILAMVQKVLGGGDRMESEIATTGLTNKHFLVRAAPLGDSGAVVVVLDITEIRRLERVRRDFVANVSHELRTPLTAIQGFAETLLRGALDEPENNRRFVEIIREHAARLGRLTEDLLKLSQIESGTMDLELHPVSVRAVIDPCADAARLRVDEKKQTLAIDVGDPSLLVLADAHALQDVLRNLLDNAIQYTPAGGHIGIRASGGREVEITVEDDGIGIPAAGHDRIFERFYRVDAARSRKVGGTGLGLAIAKHLVEAMGGRIELESALGEGSRFTVVLPGLPQADAEKKTAENEPL